MSFADQLSPFLASGKSRTHLDFNSDFGSALSAMIAAAPDSVRNAITINSGFRSVDRQRQLYDAALKKYGSPAAARRWVAPPGRSQHNHGMAADLGYASPSARTWVHENASRFGLRFPMSHEPWHIELASARGGNSTTAIAAANSKLAVDASGYALDPETGAKSSVGFSQALGPEFRGLSPSSSPSSSDSDPERPNPFQILAMAYLS